MRTVFYAGLALLMGVTLNAVRPATANAQWSIGPATAEEVEARRYLYIVFADPLPGRETEFNDWYLNQHLGDLLQLEGWTGAQRFRLATLASPRRFEGGWRNSNAVFWDQGGDEIGVIRQRIADAIAGGKSRRGTSFDYGRRAGASGTFEVAGPRVVRPDGRGPTVIPYSDNTSTRLNRYVYLEFSDLPDDADARREAERALDARILQMLEQPGWLAAQRFTFVPLQQTPNGPAFTPYPSALTVWETEGADAVSVQELMTQAQASGAVAVLEQSQEAQFRSTWWEPVSPHVTKEDVLR